MPKVLLKSGSEVICHRYSADGLDFLGDFATAKTMDRQLQQDPPEQLVTDHGGTPLLDLSKFEYTGTMIIRKDGTYSACLREKQLTMSEEDLQNIKVAKILLGEEDS